MDELTPQQIQAANLAAPQKIRDILMDPQTHEKIAEIAKRHQLSRVEEGLLAQVSSALMLGLIKPTDYVTTLIDYLSIAREEAAFVAQDVNREVFNSVKEELKQIHDVQKTVQMPLAGGSTSKSQVAFATRSGGLKEEVKPAGSIFEQKLGGAFRMSGPVQKTAPVVPLPQPPKQPQTQFSVPQAPKTVPPAPAQALPRLPSVVPQKPLVQKTTPQTNADSPREIRQELVRSNFTGQAQTSQTTTQPEVAWSNAEVAPPASQEEERPQIPTPPVPQKPGVDPYREKY